MAQLNPTFLVYTERDLLKDIKRLEIKQDSDARTKEQVKLLKKLHHIGKSVCQIRIGESAQSPSVRKSDHYSETGCLGNEDDYILQETDQGFSETEFVGNGFYYGDGWIATNTCVAHGGLEKAKLVFSWYEGQAGKKEPVKREACFQCNPAFSVLRESTEEVISQDLVFCNLIEQESGTRVKSLQPIKIESNCGLLSSETTVYHIYWRFEDGKEPDKLFTITKLTPDKCEDIFIFESQAFSIKGSSGSPVLVQKQQSVAAKHSPEELSLLGVFSRAESNSQLGCAISYYNIKGYAEQVTLIMSNIQRLKTLHSEYSKKSQLLLEQQSPEASWEVGPNARLSTTQTLRKALEILESEIDCLIGKESCGENTVVFSTNTLPVTECKQFPMCRPRPDVIRTAVALRSYVSCNIGPPPDGYGIYCNVDRRLPKWLTYYEAQVGTGRGRQENRLAVAILYNPHLNIFRKLSENRAFDFRKKDETMWRVVYLHNLGRMRQVRNTLTELMHYVQDGGCMQPSGYEDMGQSPGHGLQNGRENEKYHKADINRGCWRVIIGVNRRKEMVCQYCTYDHYKTIFQFK